MVVGHSRLKRTDINIYRSECENLISRVNSQKKKLVPFSQSRIYVNIYIYGNYNTEVNTSRKYTHLYNCFLSRISRRLIRAEGQTHIPRSAIRSLFLFGTEKIFWHMYVINSNIISISHEIKNHKLAPIT